MRQTRCRPGRAAPAAAAVYITVATKMRTARGRAAAAVVVAAATVAGLFPKYVNIFSSSEVGCFYVGVGH